MTPEAENNIYSFDRELHNQAQQEVDGHISKEEKERHETIKHMPMQAELKHLEKRFTNKGVPYIVEPREEEIQHEEINWWER